MKTLISSVILAIIVSFTALIGTNSANATAMRFTTPIEVAKNSNVIKVHRRHHRRYRHYRHRRYHFWHHYHGPSIHITLPRIHLHSGTHRHRHRHGRKRHTHRHWRGHHH